MIDWRRSSRAESATTWIWEPTTASHSPTLTGRRVERGWSGLLIEPALNRYLELRADRSTRNSFVCTAYVPFDYADEFVHLRYGNLMGGVTPRWQMGYPT
jgi:hypothetical protein